MRRRLLSGTEDFKIELTSLVDIMFLLILFLILTTTFTVSQGKFNVKLPSAVTSASETQQNGILTIVVTSNDEIYFGSKKVTIEGLMNSISTYVQQHGKPKAVYLKADKDARYGVIVKIMDVLRMQKVLNINLIVKKLQ
ncbi:ExbD/TolR family protein [Mesoaciditoga sp.]